ncbi:Sec-independent protein translocase protein TATA chloroplastic [Bienertia sinuspersici]
MEESSASGRGRNKRFWNTEEDKALIAALHELSTDPRWKCDNGFRNGYMIRLEEMIGKSVPGCGLKASPHIDSRLKTLVGKFRAILQMLGTKGFKWDDKKHMISVERSLYEEYCKTHSNCKNLYGVSFPHLHVMMEIYGKDYATGKPVEGFQDAVENMEKEDNAQVNTDASDDDVEGSGIQTLESAPPLKKVKRDKASKKKGSEKVTQSSGSLELACLQNFMKDINAHLSTMASVWSRADEREQDIADKCDKVLGELLRLDGLSPIEALDAANILTAQPNKLKIFFNCPTHLKKQYVKNVLGSVDNGSSCTVANTM